MFSTVTFSSSSTWQPLPFYLTHLLVPQPDVCQTLNQLVHRDRETESKSRFYRLSLQGRLFHPLWIHKPSPSMSRSEELHELPKSRLEFCYWLQRHCHACTLPGFETMLATQRSASTQFAALYVLIFH